VWWLDVEMDNSWSDTDIGANRAALQGSLDFLQRQAGVVVGIYSTPRMWARIMGDHHLVLPNWTAGALTMAEAVSHCSPVFSATGGPVVLSQWVEGFDNNYVC
jgi:GH25 family lysozyme M1 (1,4-beta-N-acetylmuramidase)